MARNSRSTLGGFTIGDAVRYTGPRNDGRTTGVMIGVRDERGIYVKWSNGDEGSVLVTHVEIVNPR